MKKTIFFFLSGAGIILLSQCTKTDPVGAGTGTLIGNPSAALVGALYYRGGSPAKNVVVHIRKQSSLAQTPGSTRAIQLNDTASVVTDDKGEFAFKNTLDSGMYAIEAQSGDSSVFIDSISVSSKAAPTALAPDTLRPSGAIKGSIRLAGVGDPSNVFVLAFGINRFATVQADGSFLFFPLAQGSYDLRVISTLDNYGVLDPYNIRVASSDTTNLGVLELPYTGIPIPKHVVVSYDTMKQIVTLCWNNVDAGNVKSFNVYRNLYMINTSPITDTIYCDSTVVQDNTYGYRVVSVDTTETEGPPSAEAGITAVGAFVPASSVTLSGTISGEVGFVIDNSGNIWAADYKNNAVSKYSPSGSFIAQWRPSGCSPNDYPPDIKVDARGNIYLANVPGYMVQKYDSSGALLQSMSDSMAKAEGIYTVCVEENGCVYGGFSKGDDYSQGGIYKFNSDFAYNKLVVANAHCLYGAMTVRGGKVYCAGINNYNPLAPIQPLADNVVEVYDTSGQRINTIHINQGGEKGNVFINAVAVDKDGLIYCIDEGSAVVRIFNEASDFIGKFTVRPVTFVPSDMSASYHIDVSGDGTVLLREYLNQSGEAGSIKIHFFKRRGDK